MECRECGGAIIAWAPHRVDVDGEIDPLIDEDGPEIYYECIDCELSSEDLSSLSE